MHVRSTVLAAVTVSTTLALLSAGPVSAAVQTDPAKTPAKIDIVGVGSDTTQDVIGQSAKKLGKSGFVKNYNAAAGRRDPKLWSFDAFPVGEQIVTTKGCDPITRPTGSSAGITALKNDQAAGTECIDFARSSRVKNPATDGNLEFVPFGRDGVSWATFPKSRGGFNAPADLTVADLAAIYNCAANADSWDDFGGAAVPIEPYLPQTGSGTRSFWLSAIGVATPGACVHQPEGMPENDGSAVPAADRPNAIVPYSIAKWLAQKAGVSDDVRKKITLRQIQGTQPIVDDELNPAFFPAFLRDVFNVLKPEDMGKSEFQDVFARDGYICTHPQITKRFGFGALSGDNCGYTR